MVAQMESKLIRVTGDLFKFPASHKAHQCNCVSDLAAGLAGELFARYPETNVYLPHFKEERILGRIKPIFVEKTNEVWIAMFAQFYPGRSRYPNDLASGRMEAFRECLRRIRLEVPEIQSIAFPEKIGCGLAGGRWREYVFALETFASLAPYPVYCVEKEC